MTAIWLAIAVLALWLLLHRTGLRDVRRQIEETRRDMYRAQYEAQESLHKTERELTLLRLEERARIGELRVQPSTPVADALKLHPEAQAVLTRFNVTGGGAGGETLAQAAETYAQDLEALLVALSRLIGGADAPGAAESREPQSDAFRV